jgi:hypothetical protein
MSTNPNTRRNEETTSSRSRSPAGGPLGAVKNAKQAPAKAKVEKYLKAHNNEISDEVSVVDDAGCEVYSADGTQPPKKQGSKVGFQGKEETSVVAFRQQQFSGDDESDDRGQALSDSESNHSKQSSGAGTTSSQGTDAAQNTGMTIINVCGAKLKIPFTVLDAGRDAGPHRAGGHVHRYLRPERR